MSIKRENTLSPPSKPKSAKLQLTVDGSVDRLLSWMADRTAYGTSRGDIAANILHHWAYHHKLPNIPTAFELIENSWERGDDG